MKRYRSIYTESSVINQIKKLKNKNDFKSLDYLELLITDNNLLSDSQFSKFRDDVKSCSNDPNEIKDIINSTIDLII